MRSWIGLGLALVAGGGIGWFVGHAMGRKKGYEEGWTVGHETGPVSIAPPDFSDPTSPDFYTQGPS